MKSKRVASLLRNSRAAATKFGIRSAPSGRVTVCLILLRARMQLHEPKNKFFAHALHPHFAFIKNMLLHIETDASANGF